MFDIGKKNYKTKNRKRIINDLFKLKQIRELKMAKRRKKGKKKKKAKKRRR